MYSVGNIITLSGEHLSYGLTIYRFGIWIWLYGSDNDFVQLVSLVTNVFITFTIKPIIVAKSENNFELQQALFAFSKIRFDKNNFLFLYIVYIKLNLKN